MDCLGSAIIPTMVLLYRLLRAKTSYFNPVQLFHMHYALLQNGFH